ncbi:PREDICTED: uncharacterized protein LOC106326788 [Brassica oleracea var. oleracea]|uniref:uncharacterized protein LOC106326788 n=1 Tax=Brassica oleracea var. oleracea TaxID=109376 RepID=UPI0006A6AF37|nr:PREDICTED: uncharacterized protein LOC106326788 [Brassica oleracea var. oleracea]
MLPPGRLQRRRSCLQVCIYADEMETSLTMCGFKLLTPMAYHVYEVSHSVEPWKLEDYQPPCHLQMELQNRDIFSGFPTTRTLTLGLRRASRFFTNQKSSLHILEHFIRICSYINFSQPREQETLEFHCNTIERMVWSGPNAVSDLL